MDDERALLAAAEALDEDDAFAPFVRTGEPIDVSRKKILLRLLAAREADRLGLTPTADVVARTTAAFAARCGFASAAAIERWRSEQGLDLAAFDRLIREIALVDLLDERFEEQILRELPLQRSAQAALRHDPERWTQLNIELVPTPAGLVASAARVFDRLSPLVSPPTRLPELHRFFLMRKPPGLRVRISGRHREPPVHGFLEALRDCERDGAVMAWSAVPYEPERFRFGSRRALDIAHEWFDADSVGWLRWEPLAWKRESRLGREVLSLAILNDLFVEVLEDAAEVWDVWCRIAAHHQIAFDEPASRIPPVTLATLDAFASPAEQDLLRHYHDANAAAASSLRDAARCSQLAVGPRTLLATLALFHWNRYGFSLDARRQIVGPMLRATDPHVRGDGDVPGRVSR